VYDIPSGNHPQALVVVVALAFAQKRRRDTGFIKPLQLFMVLDSDRYNCIGRSEEETLGALNETNAEVTMANGFWALM
jgi:hypothetical protein